ncbi:MAG: flagellar hook-basal body complex protein [Pseudomonadota bacterium]
MDNALYVNITRQSALLDELQVIASNLANMNTDGYRREASVFSEYVKDVDGPYGSLSMAASRGRYVDETQGALTPTGSQFDLAVEGDGFFMVEGDQGEQWLTRGGSFTPSENSELVTSEGRRVLSADGGPVFVPPNAKAFEVGPDGSISADGQPLGQLALVNVPPETLKRVNGMMFTSGEEPQQVLEGGRIAQGFLEQSNVSAVQELTRMVEVQRAYELGAQLGTQEDDRISNLISTLGRPV